MTKQHKLRGKSAYAFLSRPDKYGMYSINIVGIPKSQLKELKKNHVRVKTNDDGEFYAKFSKRAEYKDGTTTAPPTVVGRNKQPFKEILGNGSEVIVYYKERSYVYQGDQGMTTDLVAVQVVDHVPYIPVEFEDFEDEETDENLDDEDELDIDEDDIPL